VIDAVLLPSRTTVVDIIVNSPDHNTLEAAVSAANLVGPLSGVGPFTVFAPTDDAFAALDTGVLDALLMDPTGALTDILLYHVVGAEAASGSLMNGQVIATLNGKDVVVTIDMNGVFINNAQVTVVDIQTDNGIVHVIDAVLLPPRITVVDVIVNSPDHNTLETAVVAAGLAGTLSGDGPFTVFAPTDAAFAALDTGVLDALLMDPMGALTDVLLYHVLGLEAPSSALSDGQIVPTLLSGESVQVSIVGNSIFINDAEVTVADIQTDNGIVHVIDAVLDPNFSSVSDVDIRNDLLKIYPNPTSDILTIELDVPSSKGLQYSIYNLYGKIVKQWESDNTTENVQLNGLNDGQYVLRVTDNSTFSSLTRLSIFK
ncbi:UNVERIFIED_CONTAM: hypothetical protein GTU68_014575, partial [Idotea baltica]|nr:hypothetical protein [Idotea baltica]